MRLSMNLRHPIRASETAPHARTANATSGKMRGFDSGAVPKDISHDIIDSMMLAPPPKGAQNHVSIKYIKGFNARATEEKPNRSRLNTARTESRGSLLDDSTTTTAPAVAHAEAITKSACLRFHVWCFAVPCFRRRSKASVRLHISMPEKSANDTCVQNRACSAVCNEDRDKVAERFESRAKRRTLPIGSSIHNTVQNCVARKSREAELG